MNIKFYIGSELLDFNEEFNVMFSIGDINNLSFGNANKSYTLNIPLTKTNRKILKFITDPSVKTEIASIGRLYIGELLVMAGTVYFMGYNGNSAQVILKSDDWIDALKDKKMTSLDLSAYDHLFTSQNVVDSWSDVNSIKPSFVTSSHITFTELCNVLGDWNVFHGTKALVSSNVELTGAAGDSGLYATKILSSPINITGKHIAFNYYIPSGSAIHYVYLHFDCSTGYDDWTDYFEQRCYIYNDGVGGYSGWHLFTGACGNNDWTVHGSPNWNNVKYVRIYTETDSTTNSKVRLGSLYAFTPPNTKGLVMVGMDGAYSGQINAYQYANSLGFPITIFCSEPNIGGVGRMTMNDLHDFVNAFDGNLVASYCYSLSINWQTMTLAQQIQAVNMNAAYLQANGFDAGSRMCSPPGVGVRTEDVINDIMSSLVYIPAGFNNSESVIANLWDVKSLYIAVSPAGLGAATLTGLLDRAVDDKVVINELWHSPYDGIDGTQALWEDHMDELAAAIGSGDIEVVTPSDIWNSNFSYT